MYPIGTIILLNEGKRKIMILNRGSLCKNEEGEINYFDYSGCIYPVGHQRKKKRRLVKNNS